MTDTNPATDPTTQADVAFLVATVKAIVSHPDDVIAERSVDDLGVLIKLRVNEDDMSKIVGKEGRTAKALRTLLRLVGSKFDQRVNLKILEPDGSERRADKPAAEAPAEKKAPVKAEKPAAKKSEEKEAEPKESEDAGEAFENVI